MNSGHGDHVRMARLGDHRLAVAPEHDVNAMTLVVDVHAAKPLVDDAVPGTEIAGEPVDEHRSGICERATETLTSIFDEPSKGSIKTTYLF